MRYAYYPGCSLKASSLPYEESLLAVFNRLGVAMPEINDWNCCGGTTYFSADETKAFVLAARNLCLAEAEQPTTDVHMVAPCSACYLFHAKTQASLKAYPAIGRTVFDALAAENLHYSGRVMVRHPLDVLRNDVGLERIKKEVQRPLEGLKVACYYGCQVVRPLAAFDDPRAPASMDELVAATGATPIDWPLKTRCCGASLTGTVAEAGLRLSQLLLREAKRRGADVVATACPLCQFNLECYQDKMKARWADDVALPVVFFTQLLGRAMGIPDGQIGLKRLFVPLPQRPPVREEVPA
jgi:heterodisulfide reductase subunit B